MGFIGLIALLVILAQLGADAGDSDRAARKGGSGRRSRRSRQDRWWEDRSRRVRSHNARVQDARRRRGSSLSDRTYWKNR